MKQKDFFRALRSSTSGDCGTAPKDFFLERLNIRYLDLQTGYAGEADISPQQFSLPKERTEHLLSQEMLDVDMDMLLAAYFQNAPMSEQPAALETQPFEQANSHTLRQYRDIVRHISADTNACDTVRDAARNLQYRLLALTPREFRRSALETQIAAAKANNQPTPWTQMEITSREEVR